DYDSEKASIEDITEKIENVGYGVLTEKAEFDVFGMTCAACSTRIEKVLNKQEGVRQAEVNLTTETASIEYNHGITDIKSILNKKSEYEDLEKTLEESDKCNEKLMNKQEEERQETVNLNTETASIKYNPGLTDIKSIIEKIKNVGYDAKPKADSAEKQTHKEK